MIEMSPDLQRALIVLGLLIGPTSLWHLYRWLRGPDRTIPDSMLPSAYDHTGSPFGTAGLEAFIAGSGTWPCEICSSLNQPEANRCYKCHALRPVPRDPLATPIDAEPPVAPEPAPPIRPARRRSTPAAVPVIAAIATAGVAQPSGRRRPVVTAMNAGDISRRPETVPAAASIPRLPLPGLAVSRGVPVMEETVGNDRRATRRGRGPGVHPTAAESGPVPLPTGRRTRRASTAAEPPASGVIPVQPGPSNGRSRPAVVRAPGAAGRLSPVLLEGTVAAQQVAPAPTATVEPSSGETGGTPARRHPAGRTRVSPVVPAAAPELAAPPSEPAPRPARPPRGRRAGSSAQPPEGPADVVGPVPSPDGPGRPGPPTGERRVKHPGAVGATAPADGITAALLPTAIVCPLLGLQDDPLSRLEFPHPAHRCRATALPGIISVQHQQTFCYGIYGECVRFRAHAEASGDGAEPPAGNRARRPRLP